MGFEQPQSGGGGNGPSALVETLTGIAGALIILAGRGLDAPRSPPGGRGDLPRRSGRSQERICDTPAGAVHTDEFAQLRDLFPLVLERAFLEIVSDVEDERPSHGTSLDR
jgi:hypothetical protein